MSVSKLKLQNGYIYRCESGDVYHWSLHHDDEEQARKGVEMIGIILDGEDVMFDGAGAKAFEESRANIDVMDVFDVNWSLV